MTPSRVIQSAPPPQQQQQSPQLRQDKSAVWAAVPANEPDLAAAQEQVQGVLARVKEAQAAAQAAAAAAAAAAAPAVTDWVDSSSMAPPPRKGLQNVSTTATPSSMEEEDLPIERSERNKRSSVPDSEDDDDGDTNNYHDLDAVYRNQNVMELEPVTDVDDRDEDDEKVTGGESWFEGEHATLPRDVTTRSSEPKRNTAADSGSFARFRLHSLQERVRPRFSSLLGGSGGGGSGNGGFQRNDALPRSAEDHHYRDTPVTQNGNVEGTEALPLMAPKYIRARQQPKDPMEEIRLQQKYAAIESLEERAFQILLDLGMVNHEG